MAFVEELLIALVAHTTAGFVHQLGHGDSEVVEKVRRLEQLVDKDTTLAGIIRDSASFMNNEVKSNNALAQGLRGFFKSSDVHAVARQLFAFTVDRGTSSNVIPEIRLELNSLLSLYLGPLSDFDLERTTDEVLTAILQGCKRGLSIAIDKGHLSAHEASSSARHAVILGELSGIKANLEFLAGTTGTTVAEVDKFEKLFRREAGQNHKFIKPPHFDASKRIPIDKLYVPSDLVWREVIRKDQPPFGQTAVPLRDFLARLHRVVVLGSPGGGKSTLVSKIAHDLWLRRAQIAGREMTPIVVVLRQYGAAKRERSLSILDFIETVANSDYQVKPPVNAVKYLLLNGRAMVLFDGLDELLDASYRQRIASDIESFCRTFPSVPVLVTSREIGYLQAPLDETMFEVARLAPFNEQQVQEYVKKWFSVGGEFTAEHQRERVASFLDESERVSDLRSVPLLLALMCNIYRGAGYIPKNRPDVYAKCAEMLFERWDKARGIAVPLPFDAHLRPAMMYLAHWLYTSGEVEPTVTEQQLVKEAAGYLLRRRFEDTDQATAAAREFVEFCRGRAWVFTDTGLLKDGEPLYQFTHRTFLEYFTAAHLVRTAEGVKNLTENLLPHIKRGEWEVVAQLSCQIEDRQREGAGDEILSFLVEASKTPQIIERWNLMTFAVRTLEHIVPSPRVVRSLVASLVQHTIEYHKGLGAGVETQPNSPTQNAPQPSWEAVLHIAPENRDCFAAAMLDEIVKIVNSGESETAYIGWEIAFFLENRGRHPLKERGWPEFDDLIKQRQALLRSAAEAHFGLCRYLVGSGAMTAYDMATFHGIQSLFLSWWRVGVGGGWSPVADWIVGWLKGNHGAFTPSFKKRVLADLDKLGALLIDAPAPWAAFSKAPKAVVFRVPGETDVACGVQLKGRTLFAAFALLAALFEVDEPTLNSLATTKSELIGIFRKTYSNRFQPEDIAAVTEELANSGLNEREIQFALDWSSGKKSLISISTENESSAPRGPSKS